MALTIVQIKLSAEAICGVTLEPYLQVRKGTSTTVSGEDVPEEGVSDSRYVLRYRWYRSVHRGGQICWIHPDREATVQCILCLRSRAEIRKSFHCTPECLQQHWPQHRQLHEQRRLKGPENGYVTELSRSSQTVTAGGETWIEVGKGRSYTPSPEDVGSSIKCEIVPVDSSSHFNETGAASSASTGRVRPVPLCPQRALVPVPPPRGGNPAGKFTALTYNLLADLYASVDAHGHCCQQWALSWQYRKQNLLKELLTYKADILCLQEVQSNHFDNFLAPELQKAGYTAIYKRKTTELYTGSSYAIDGCATFFKRDKFALVKKYEVEFNKAALSLSDSIPADQKKAALNRLLKVHSQHLKWLESRVNTRKSFVDSWLKPLKDNVALIAVLEALDPPQLEGANRRQLICIANTHIHANPELNDVKLWQVHTLLKGLEKIAASADIPMLVAGDFNSVPGSAAHSLLVNRIVENNHPELQNDPLGILRPASKLQHNLHLASAYAAVHEARDGGPALQKQKRRMDPKYHEPKVAVRASAAAANIIGTEQPCRVRLRLWHCSAADPTAALEVPSLTIPDAVLCSEMGVHFSACGRYLAACVACQAGHLHDLNPDAAGIIYEVRVYSLEAASLGQVLHAKQIRAAHCLTSVQFSPTSEHLLLAYGRRHISLLRSLVPDGTSSIIPVHTILEVYRVSDMSLVRVLPSAEDEVNAAAFHPHAGGGLAYGTKEGKLRILRHDPRPEARTLATCQQPRGLEDELREAESIYEDDVMM